MMLLGVLFLVLFIGCLLGALIGGIFNIDALFISCVVSAVFVIIIFVLLDKLIKKIKANNVKKFGKTILAKVVGATFGGKQEVYLGGIQSETNYFFPIFAVEDIYGVKTYYNAINMITGEDLKKLTVKGEVEISVYKNYCIVTENLLKINDCGAVPYLGKNMSVNENGWWQPKKLNRKESKKQKSQSHAIYKVAIVFLSVISVLILGGAIAFIVYGIISKQYSLIIGAVVAILFVIFSDFKLLFKMVLVLKVDKKGTETYAISFDTEVLNYNSTSGGSSTNYVVKFTFYDSFGNLKNGEEYVLDSVFFQVRSLERLPIKVYKKHGAINQDALYR